MGFTRAWPNLPAEASASSGSAFEYQLAAASSQGATTFTIDRTAAFPLQAGATIIISANTTRAELKSVSSVSGTTVTVSAMNVAHSDDDLVVILPGYTVITKQFGLTGDATDESTVMQRLVHEATQLALRIEGRGGQIAAQYYCSKPILVPSSSQFRELSFRAHTGHIAQSAGAVLMVGQQIIKVTSADASTNVLTCAGGHGLTAGFDEATNTKCAFRTMYAGETLPGGITEGRAYWVDTVPNSTTFTISETEGGAIHDITSDGSGWFLDGIEELARVYWENVRVDLPIADVNGIRLSMQQPAYITGCRIEMSAVATTRAYGILVGGQIGYITNLEINPEGNCTGVYLYGTGLTLRNVNFNGVDNNDIGIDVVGADSATIDTVWTETIGLAGIRLSSGRAIAIQGAWLHSPADLTTPALLVVDDEISYQVGMIRSHPGSATMLISDTAKGYTIYAQGGADAASSSADYQQVFHGWVSPGTNGAATEQMTPRFAHRFTKQVTSDYTVRYIDEFLLVSTTAASRTVTLPVITGWGGLEFTINHKDGANTCTVDTADAATIDGSASITVPPGGSVTVVATTGGNYVITSERA